MIKFNPVCAFSSISVISEDHRPVCVVYVLSSVYLPCLECYDDKTSTFMYFEGHYIKDILSCLSIGFDFKSLPSESM